MRLKSRERIEAENLALRHQLNVVCRSARKRVRLCRSDRLLFIWLYRLWPGVLDLIVIVQPETVVRWHRGGFKAFWRLKSRGAPGRPRIPKEIRDLIRKVSLANPLWGAPRIHGELLKVGIDVAQSTVAKYMVRGRRPPSILQDLSDKPRRWHCLDRFLRGFHGNLQIAVRPRHVAPRPASADSCCRHRQSNGRLDRPPDLGGLSLGHGAQRPRPRP